MFVEGAAAASPVKNLMPPPVFSLEVILAWLPPPPPVVWNISCFCPGLDKIMLPHTSNFSVGADVPMPMLPLLSSVICTVLSPFVKNDIPSPLISRELPCVNDEPSQK